MVVTSHQSPISEGGFDRRRVFRHPPLVRPREGRELIAGHQLGGREILREQPFSEIGPPHAPSRVSAYVG